MDQSYIVQEKESEDIIQLVCFVFADEQYALPIGCVREVLRVPRLTPVPQMPDFTLGVIHIRGLIVPVFDLRKKFGLAQKISDHQTKLLVAEVRGVVMGFVVDAVLDNIKISRASIDPSPGIKMKIKKECIAGLGQMEGRMIVILNLERLSDSIQEDILEAARSQE